MRVEKEEDRKEGVGRDLQSSGLTGFFIRDKGDGRWREERRGRERRKFEGREGRKKSGTGATGLLYSRIGICKVQKSCIFESVFVD